MHGAGANPVFDLQNMWVQFWLRRPIFVHDGRFWNVGPELGPCWASVGPFWVMLAPYWAHGDAFWNILGSVLARVGTILS